jgi:hypothetical protein
MTTLLAVMYNLVSDVVGGVEIVVLEETITTGGAQVVSPATTRRPALTTADVPTQETPVTTPNRG